MVKTNFTTSPPTQKKKKVEDTLFNMSSELVISNCKWYTIKIEPNNTTFAFLHPEMQKNIKSNQIQSN